MIVIDGRRAAELVDQVVDEAGKDFVYGEDYAESLRQYGTCRYAVEGTPACIVGRALVKAGVPVEELRLIEGSSIACYEVRALPLSDVKITREAIAVLRAAQESSDNDHTWGVARERAWAVYEEQGA